MTHQRNPPSALQPTVRQVYSPQLRVTSFIVDVPDAIVLKTEDQQRYLAEAMQHLTLTALRQQMDDWKAKILLVLSAKRVANRLHVQTMWHSHGKGNPNIGEESKKYHAKKRILNKIVPRKGHESDAEPI